MLGAVKLDKIYKLIDPRNNSIRYIGLTSKTLDARLSKHLADAKTNKKTHKCNWIRSLISNDITPIIRLIEECSENESKEREIYWISYYGRENLVNGTNGGDGTR